MSEHLNVIQVVDIRMSDNRILCFTSDRSISGAWTVEAAISSYILIETDGRRLGANRADCHGAEVSTPRLADVSSPNARCGGFGREKEVCVGAVDGGFDWDSGRGRMS